MVAIPVANGCQLAVRYNIQGQPAVTVLGGYWTVPPAVTIAEGQRWLNAWWDAVRPSITDAVSCMGAEFRDLSNVPGAAVEIPAPPLPKGGIVASLSLSAASYIVKWQTATPGRSGRGRTFVPGVTENNIEPDGRSIVAAAVGVLQGNVEAKYRNVLVPAAGNVVPGVISRKQAFCRQVNGQSVGAVVGIQRRRMR